MSVSAPQRHWRWCIARFGPYLPFEPAAAHLLFLLISHRCERGSLLITSDRAVGDWGTVLGDQVVATAIHLVADSENSSQPCDLSRGLVVVQPSRSRGARPASPLRRTFA